MKGHFTMRGELHEFLDADAGQFGRAAKGDTPLAEQFERQELAGATRWRLVVQSRKREDFFWYFHANHRHATSIAQAAIGGKPVFLALTRARARRMGDGLNRVVPDVAVAVARTAAERNPGVWSVFSR